MAKAKRNSQLEKILLALIPYTKENADLLFRPWSFFADLERQQSIDINTANGRYPVN